MGSYVTFLWLESEEFTLKMYSDVCDSCSSPN